MPVIDFTAAQGGILRINGFLRRGVSIGFAHNTGSVTVTGTLSRTLDEDTLVAAGSTVTGTLAATLEQDTLAAAGTMSVAPQWGSVTTNSALAAASTGVTITKPSGLVDTDVLYAFISKSSFADSNNFTCSGWTSLLAAGTTTENDRHITILRKVITSASGEPANYTFVTTSGTTVGMAGLIVRVSGANNTTPEDVTPTSSHRVFAVNDATPASVDITTVTANTLVMQYCMLQLSSTATKTWGAPSGYTQDPLAVVAETTSASSDQQCGVAYKTQAAAGAVGTNVWTHTADDSSTDNVAAVIVVRPA
jgi:hypothetical protein